jgi:3-hydroxyisobutyrate dehydrogenase-like beta-hydroxyacid dehydrogenase
MASENPRLGFIGMGGMGSRMAARLLAAGYDLTTYNRHRERARVLEKQGAKIAAQPGELAAHADIVLSSLADDVAVENVMLGPGGALAAARPGTVFIGMSTVSPSLSRRLHDFAHEKGIFVLDAPVSGTTTVAEKGELVIFVGGDKAAYERCLPVLKVLGRVAHYMGPAGSGAAMKLCANTLLGLGMQALAEAVAFGLKAGLARERLLEVLAATAVVSPSQKSKLDNVLNEAYPPAFPLRLMLKDYNLILDTAMALRVAMPATAAAEQVSAAELARQSAAGRDEDFSSVVRAMEQSPIRDPQASASISPRSPQSGTASPAVESPGRRR